MFLSLRNNHKQHLAYLGKQSSQVLVDFCKLALDYLQNGPNIKRYSIAAHKLEVTPEVIQSAVESLVNLLIESCKNKLSEQDFIETTTSLGFGSDHQSVLVQFYGARQGSVGGALGSLGPSLPFYRDLQWRFEAQIASRYLNRQAIPRITLKLQLQQHQHVKHTNIPLVNNSIDTDTHKMAQLSLNDERISSTKCQDILLQTDPNNLMRMIDVLERALQEGKSQRVRGITKALE